MSEVNANRRVVKAFRCRHWFFTDFNITDERKDSYKKFATDSCVYMCIGLETCPTTNNRHLQGWFTLTNARTESGMRNQFPGYHLEKATSNSDACTAYCSKESVFFKFGTPVVTPATRGAMGGSATAFRYKLAIAAVRAGNMEGMMEDHPDLMVRHTKFFTDLYEKSKNIEPLQEIRNVWISGPPGCGKTKWVHDNVSAGNLYQKQATKWWDHYDSQPMVLIDDVTPDNFRGLHLDLLNWADRYPFRCEIKGGSLYIRPKFLLVTSNFTLQDTLTRSNVNIDHEALLRRFPMRVELSNGMTEEEIQNAFTNLTLSVFPSTPTRHVSDAVIVVDDDKENIPPPIPLKRSVACASLDEHPLFKCSRVLLPASPPEPVPDRDVYSLFHPIAVTGDEQLTEVQDCLQDRIVGLG